MDKHPLLSGQQLARTREILTAPRWEDLRFPVQGIDPPGATADPNRSTADGILEFSSSAINIIAGVAQLPHAWDAGTEIHPHIHWTPSDTGAGNVLWRFEYEVQNVNGIYTGYASDDALVAVTGVDDQHILTEFAPVDMTGMSESCIMKWRISRIGNDGTDTYTKVARLYEFDIHYQVAKLGTVREYNNIY